MILQKFKPVWPPLSAWRWIGILILPLTILVDGPAGSAMGSTFYVSKSGSDKNSGLRLSRPLRTLAAAAAQMRPGDTCLIMAGVYHQTLKVLHSGAIAHPVTFEPYHHAHVVIDAADPITGWRHDQRNIYSAPMSQSLGLSSNQVFLNGRMILPARYPPQPGATPFSPGTAQVVAPARGKNSYFSTARRLVSPQFAHRRSNYFRGATFVGWVGVAWSVQTASVAASNSAGILRLTHRTHTWWFGGRGDGYLIGLRRFLRVPNQWVYHAGRLYLCMPPGRSPAQYRLSVRRRAWCVNIRGQSWVVIRDLVLHGGAVRIAGDYCKLTHCRCRYLGQYLPIAMDRKAAPHAASFQHCGIIVTGNHNTVQYCRIAWSAGDGISIQGNDNLISRNLIRNVDYSGTLACALQVLAGSGNQIAFNTAWNAGRAILQFHQQPQHDLVEFNNFYHPGLLCRDLGVIYTWGTNGGGSRITCNWIHGNHNHGPNPGIYLDNGCRNFIVDHNVIWNCPGDAGVRINGPCANELIINNTLLNCLPVGARMFVSLRRPHWPVGVHYQSINNLFLGKNPEQQLADPAQNNFRLKPGAPAIHAGRVVPGITPLLHGRPPDLGAYQQGQPYWTPGVTGKK